MRRSTRHALAIGAAFWPVVALGQTTAPTPLTPPTVITPAPGPVETPVETPPANAPIVATPLPPPPMSNATAPAGPSQAGTEPAAQGVATGPSAAPATAPGTTTAPSSPQTPQAGGTAVAGPGSAAAPATATAPPAWKPAGSAEIQVLDKENAVTRVLTVKVGDSVTYGALTIAVKACVVRPPDVPSDAAAYLDITDSHKGEPGFQGWTLRDEPWVSMLENPLYDVRVLGCPS